jgi:hypothetical protein
MTEDEFKARIKLPEDVYVWYIEYREAQKITDKVTQANMVRAAVWAPTAEKAQQGAVAILDAIDGLETHVRIEPTSESHRDPTTEHVEHRGFVRFAFFDWPGLRRAPEPRSEINPTYMGIAR